MVKDPIKILIVDDDATVGYVLKRQLSDEGYECYICKDGREALERLEEEAFDIVVTDIRMPRMDGAELLGRVQEISPNTNVIVITGHGNVKDAVRIMKIGAFDYLTKPVDSDEIKVIIQRAIEQQRLKEEIGYLRSRLEGVEKFGDIIGQNAEMERLFQVVETIAEGDLTVLIEGESGTGKELIADALHYNGDRKDKALIKVNCASLPKDLLESEMFGHERGAFSGAHKMKLGRFELAEGGTLFLDEISEIDLSLQAKLLRALEGKGFERVGGTETIRTDIRIIAATNENLKESIKKKSFREDLYYRLNVINIKVPPLRNRRDDIPALASHFLENVSQKNHRSKVTYISKEAMEALCRYEYPGNVRELENAIIRAFVTAKTDSITVEDLTDEIKESTQEIGSQNKRNKSLTIELSHDKTLKTAVEEVEKKYIEQVLEMNGGDKSKTAKMLGVGRRTLYDRLAKYDIS